MLPKNMSHCSSTVAQLKLRYTLRSELHKYLEGGISVQVWKLKQMGSQEWSLKTRAYLTAINEKLSSHSHTALQQNPKSDVVA